MDADDKVLRQEMQSDQIGPPPMPEPVRLNPFLQRIIEDSSKEPTEWITEAPDEDEQIY
jgi:hypothetical protein